MSEKLRFGLLGLGRHGSRYAAHLGAGEVPRATLSRFWRRDPERARRSADELGVPSAPSIAALIGADDVDVVAAAVPPTLHLEIARLAARHRKSLLLEKPLAPSRRDADEILALDLVLTVAQTLRFDPLVLALRGKTPSIGRLVGFSFEQRIEPRGLEWETDPSQAGGGVALQSAVHTIDALRFVTGREVELVHAALARVHTKDVEDHAHFVLRAGDALGSVAASKIGRSRHVRFALYGEDGALEADLMRRTLVEARGADVKTETIAAIPTVRAVLEAFVGHLRGEGPLPVDPRSARMSLEPIFRSYEGRLG